MWLYNKCHSFGKVSIWYNFGKDSILNNFEKVSIWYNFGDFLYIC